MIPPQFFSCFRSGNTDALSVKQVFKIAIGLYRLEVLLEFHLLFWSSDGRLIEYDIQIIDYFAGLNWVPGYSGIQQNETADRPAREGARPDLSVQNPSYHYP